MPETSKYPLHEVAASGDIDALNRLLEDGAEVDGRDEVGRTPLFCAAGNGELVAARHLLKRGARVDSTTSSATTALMTAARGGHAEMVRLLLASGADPNQEIHPCPVVRTLEQEEMMQKFRGELAALAPSEGQKAEVSKESQAPRRANTLVRAIMSRDSETILALIDGGADVNAAIGQHGPTPLDMAVSFADPAIIRALIAHGASANATVMGGHSLLASAVLRGKSEKARLLLELGARPDSAALGYAITNKNVELVKLLLDFGADPEAMEGENGEIPLSARAWGDLEMLALLAAHRGTDWHELVLNGDLDSVRIRLDAGVAVDVRDDKGKTALMLAAEAGHVDLVKLLLERGADPDAGDKSQITALMSSVQKGHLETSRELLVHGANVKAMNHWGQTAVASALSDERREIRELLGAFGAEIGIVEAAQLGDTAGLMSFLADGISVNTANSAGMTPLMGTASRGNLELATLLFDRGADLSPRNTRGNNAFQIAVTWACSTGETALLARMLEWGADIHSPGSNDSCILQIPVLLGSASVMRFLLENGADPNCRTSIVGLPLLHAAIQFGRGTIAPIATLLEFGADTEATDCLEVTALLKAVSGVPKLVSKDADRQEFVRSVSRLLLAKDANVNARSRQGSVLDVAIGSGDIELVRLILDAGADVRNLGKLPGMFRYHFPRNPEITALLRERGAEIPEPGEAPEGFAAGSAQGKSPADRMSDTLDRMNATRKSRLAKAAPAVTGE